MSPDRKNAEALQLNKLERILAAATDGMSLWISRESMFALTLRQR